MRTLRLFVVILSLIVFSLALMLMLSRQGSAERAWMIVFTRSFRNEWFLVTVLPNGQVLEKPTEMRGELVWSPDNEWVAYIDSRRLDQRPLYRARPTGKNRQLLLEDAVSVVGLNWSPDREWLYFYSSGPISPVRQLFRLHVEGGNTTRLDLLDNPYCCDWSADGEWMLVDVGNSVVQSRPDGTDVQEIASMDDFDVSYPQFAADDRVIFSASQVPRTNIIYQVDMKSSDVEQISHTDYSFLPSVSPDGEQVVFLATQLDTFLTHLYKIDLDDSQPQVLTELTDYYYEYDPFISNLIWSPDGESILFLAQHDGGQGLFQVSAEGGAVETVFRVSDGKATRPHFLPFPQKNFNGWIWVLMGSGALSFVLMLQFRAKIELLGQVVIANLC